MSPLRSRHASRSHALHTAWLVALGVLLLAPSPSQAQCDPCTLWPESATPTILSDSDPNAVELGVKFYSDVPGFVTGVRFYKALANTGTHVGRLWTGTGTLLASVTFVNETGSGWQEATFDTPVEIAANTTYVISYHAPNGRYSANLSYFSGTGRDSGPLHALADGVEGGNGVYAYGPGGIFPTSTWQSANYWVDVVFRTSVDDDTTPPIVSAVSPVAQANGVSPTTAITATFNEPIDPLTVDTATFQLFDPFNALVPATVTYSSVTRRATLTPNAPLAASTTYTAVLRGGATDPRIKDVAGNALAAPFSWSFTTAAPTPPPGTCPCSLWSGAVVPGVADSGPDAPVELGVKFRSDASGFITAIRFYKSAANTGTHVVHLWSATGQLLGSGTVVSGTTTGWQEVALTQPVAVSANTTYIASYHTTTGHYGIDLNFFAASGVDNVPLHAPSSPLAGGNGVFAYGPAGSFPASSFNASNYWVDVVFDYTANDTTPPTVTSTSPAAGSTGVSTGTTVRVTFSEDVDPATLTSSTFFLRDAGGNPVAATITYSAASRTATLTPGASLQSLTTYTATVVGGSGPPRVTDLAGNGLAASTTWSFTTGGPPPDEGPGGPILVLASASNPFSRYYSEILRAEGLNAFTVTDVSNLSAGLLAGYDVVILGSFPLTANQVSVLATWVNGGGNLIAMRPDKQLASLLGLTDAGTTLSDAYLLVDTATGPGSGIVNETIQFHGTADRYTLNGAARIATLYSNATTATTAPAVTLRAVGAGQAAAFTYDLARSIVLTRQGNPAWSGQERDGFPPIRSDDLFFGAASGDVRPDWVNLNKVEIPQADEQQRLLANLILRMNQARKPLPRFWYLPRGLKAAVVMTGDDHGNNGTAGRFQAEIARSPQGCSVNDWQCVRSTSYIYPSTPISPTTAASFAAQGFEIGVHVSTNCSDYTPAQLESFYAGQLAEWSSRFPALPSPVTNRTHCIVWSDYDTQPQVALSHGIRFDTNYYYWPGSWVANRPGLFTGSAMPMRFTTAEGSIIDVYQAATQMTDESDQSFPFTINTLLDNALGPRGFYGVFVANMHTDSASHSGWDAIVTSAQARGVPIVSAAQMLRWLDGRNGSTFSSLAWSGGVLTFTVTAASGANGLQGMLPVSGGGGVLNGLTRNGQPVSYTTSTIKGITYAFFSASSGSYRATYGTPTGASLTPATLTFGDQQVGTTSTAQAVTLANTGASPLTIASVTVTGDFGQTNTCGTSLPAGASCTINVTFTPAAAGTRSGTLTVTDNGTGSPRTVTLSGTGFGTAPTWSWFTGDPHVHRSCGGSPESVSSLVSKMATNDLDLISLLADMGNGEVLNPATDLPKVGTTDPASTAGRLVRWDAEWHWDATYSQFEHQALGGHIVALGLSGATQRWEEYTGAVLDWAHAQGGIAGFAHMQYLGATGGNLANSLDCCQPIEYPVEVALGAADFISEDVNGHVETINAYYRLLNAGFRPALAAGSDYPCGVSELGGLLTYVRVPSGQFSYRNWIDNLAAGRTVISRRGNREFIGLTVNGAAAPGDEVRVSAGASVPVTIQWTSSQSQAGTIQLVRNGQVFASWVVSAGPGAPATVTVNVPFSQSGWLAARRMEGGSHAVHTGAVFVIVDNAPIRASAADAQFYVNWIDTLIQRTSVGGVWASYFTASGRSAAHARYQQARAIFQQRAAEASGAAAVSLNPSTLVFAAQAVGTTSAPRTVTLTNTGSASLTISGTSITGTNAGDFARTTTCGSTLAAGASCTITVTFTPTAAGTRSATLSIANSAPGSPHTVPLSGSGSSSGPVTVSPTSLAFGNQAVNTASAPRVVTLTNGGSTTLTINGAALGGTNPGQFSLANLCGPSLAAGASCTMSVTFAPTSTGTKSATLTITDSGTGSPRTVPLSGTGITAPSATLSPTSLTFATRLIGTTSSSQRVTLRNTGTTSLSITGITIEGANPADFIRTTTCGTSLSAGSTCRIDVSFRPTAAFQRQATLTVRHSAPTSPSTVSLTGTGTAVSVSPTSITFSSQRVGTTSSSRTITLSNRGSAALPITITFGGTNPGDFLFTNACGATLAGGASCSMTVRFRPTARNSRSATVTIVDPDPTSPQVVTISGTGR